jgi:ornithine cyclodeaminase/alanine dehydrogenase-like protein (mu-crystallin family)
MLYLSREEVFELLTHQMSVDAVEEGLKQEGRGEIWFVPRIQHDLERGWIRFMPAASKDYVGLRVYGGSIMYFLWDAHDGRPLAMMDALGIRDVRTGAVGGIGAKYMAKQGPVTASVLGSGAVARHGLYALDVVRDIKNVKVFSPTKEHREDFATYMGEKLGVNIEPVESPEEAVRGTDVIVTGAGRHGEPVVRGEWLEPGMFVMGIGNKDELDDEAVTRSNKIVIDSKAQFTYECKDVTDQVNKGLLSWDDVGEVHEMLVGKFPGRENDNEITLLKTTGTAVQDLFSAIALYKKATDIGAGKEMGDIFPRAHGWWPAPQRVS